MHLKPNYKIFFCFLIASFFFLNCFAQQYKNFRVAIYSRAYETQKMADTTGYLKPIWDEITRQLKVDKIYFEKHRDF